MILSTVSPRVILVQLVFIFCLLCLCPCVAPQPAISKCEICRLGLDLFVDWAKTNETEFELVGTLVDVCNKLQLEQPDVCAGILAAYVPEVSTILLELYANENDISHVCYDIGWCQNETRSAQPSAAASYLRKPSLPRPVPEPFKKTPNGLTVLQLSDVHMDPLYAVGSAAQCGKPLCCRADDQPIDGNRTAGAWGDYECDINEKMLHSMFTNIANTVKPDIILWTGDNPPHNVWSQSREFQLNATRRVTGFMKQYFPGIHVLPSIGNHESFPCDQFQVPPYENWLYSVMGEEWSEWLTVDARATLEYAGYYTMKLNEKLRVISLNTQYGDDINFFLLLAETDPGNQLQWLNETLWESAENDETLWILGHIPTNNHFAYPKYAQMVLDILQPHAHRIGGFFTGHVHTDGISVALDKETEEPWLVQYVSPSVTSFTHLNPSYRVYDMDSGNHVEDYKQYVTNITAANLEDKAPWILEYSARDSYQLPDMSPASWAVFAREIFTNDDLFDLYYKHYYTSSPFVEIFACHQGPCRQKLVCGTLAGTQNETAQCMHDLAAW